MVKCRVHSMSFGALCCDHLGAAVRETKPLDYFIFYLCSEVVPGVTPKERDKVRYCTECYETRKFPAPLCSVDFDGLDEFPDVDFIAPQCGRCFDNWKIRSNSEEIILAE